VTRAGAWPSTHRLVRVRVVIGAHFVPLRGTHQQLNDVGGDEEFLRLTARAGLIVERLGIVRAALGDGLEQQIGIYQQALGELT
jgi:hypothetical protein